MRPTWCLVVLAVLGGFPGGLRAEDVDHPAYLSWQREPIGSEIRIRSTSNADGHILTTTTTTRLKEMKPDRAIFAVQRTSDATGSEVISAPERYELIRKFPLFPGVKRENIGKPINATSSGAETIELAGRSFGTVWFETKTKGDGGLDVYTRTWMADNAPGRFLKSVTRIPVAKTVITVELIEWKTPTNSGADAAASASPHSSAPVP